MAISNEELIAKAREAKSAEELLALAKENNIEITEEQANDFFEQMNKTGELSDDELDSVAGGGCYKKDGRLKVTIGYSCNNWVCASCGRVLGEANEYNREISRGVCIYHLQECGGCKYYSHNKIFGGVGVCDHPKNRK